MEPWGTPQISADTDEELIIQWKGDKQLFAFFSRNSGEKSNSCFKHNGTEE